jgi:hypothetical protein
MIGLGGAEFRLPLLIGLFVLALQAVIMNKAMSLAVVLTALPARLVAVPVADLAPHWPVAVNLFHRTIRAALNEAVRRGYLHRNPAELAKTPPMTDHEVEPYSVLEVQQLLEAATHERNGDGEPLHTS